MNIGTPSFDGGGEELERLRAILGSAVNVAIIATDREGRITEWNEGAERMLGWNAAEMLGESAERFYTAEDRASGRPDAEMREALAAGFANDNRWHVRRDGSHFWASGEMNLLMGAGGAHLGFLKILTDRTSVHLAEEELRASEERRRLAAEVGEIGLWDWNLAADVLTLDDRMLAMAGTGPKRTVTPRDILQAVHPEDRERFETAFQAVVAGSDERLHIRGRLTGLDDGTARTILISARAMRDGEGRTIRLIGAARDISERVAADARRSVLNQELAHRLKNTLAIVTSIVTQTLRAATDVETGRQTLLARIHALSKAHDILLSGQRDAATVTAVVRAATALHDEGGRVAASGPDLALGPKAALTLSLIVHELATNAGKYGALSLPDGRVEMTWSVGRVEEEEGLPVLTILWREEGGPPVVAPARKGFGTRLVEMGLSGSVGGSVGLDYAPEGLRCRIVAPLVELMTEEEDGPEESWSAVLPS